MKKVSISFALASFVFLSCAALALISSILVINYVVKSTQQEQAQLIEREAKVITNGYRLFLKNRLTVLKEHASYPIMNQALMQPEANIGKLQDFMAELSVLGTTYQQSLLDFEGNIIFSKLSSKVPQYKSQTWLTKLLNNNADEQISVQKIGDEFFWCLAVAIRYNNSTEGVLTTLIPLKDISEQSNNQQKFNGLMIKVLLANQQLITFGEQIVGKQHTITWPELAITFQFTFDVQASKQELTNAIIKLSALILLALLFTFLLAYLFGYRYFVKPLLSLSQATSELDRGIEINLPKENINIKEFAHLFNKFNAMTEKVKQREMALKQSNDKLTKVNEELIFSESQLIQSEKMASIGVLAAGVAHEINNPIGFVKSNLNILQDYFADFEAYYHKSSALLNTVEQKTQQAQLAEQYDIAYIFEDITPLLESSINGTMKITEIVHSLKTFARAEQPDKSKTDVNAGLQTTLNMVRNELKYNCNIHVDLEPLPIIYAFPSKLNQVFINLLINAGQSIEGKGDIYVKTYQEDLDIVIEIRDTGCGIAKEALSQIFTPFYTSKPVGQGTGLGLSISHEIVKQHNGKIIVDSKVGQGSCFSVYIPILLNSN